MKLSFPKHRKESKYSLLEIKMSLVFPRSRDNMYILLVLYWFAQIIQAFRYIASLMLSVQLEAEPIKCWHWLLKTVHFISSLCVNKVIDVAAGVMAPFLFSLLPDKWEGVHWERILFIYTNIQCMNPSKVYFCLSQIKGWCLILDTIAVWTSDAFEHIISGQSAPHAILDVCSWGTKKKKWHWGINIVFTTQLIKTKYWKNPQKLNIVLGDKMFHGFFLYDYFKEKSPFSFDKPLLKLVFC